MRRFGPKTEDHPKIDKPCPLCSKLFKKGDYTTLIAMEPSDADEVEKMVAGRHYTAVAEEVHVECAEGLGFTVDKD